MLCLFAISQNLSIFSEPSAARQTKQRHFFFVRHPDRRWRTGNAVFRDVSTRSHSTNIYAPHRLLAFVFNILRRKLQEEHEKSVFRTFEPLKPRNGTRRRYEPRGGNLFTRTLVRVFIPNPFSDRYSFNLQICVYRLCSLRSRGYWLSGCRTPARYAEAL